MEHLLDSVAFLTGIKAVTVLAFLAACAAAGLMLWRVALALRAKTRGKWAVRAAAMEDHELRFLLQRFVEWKASPAEITAALARIEATINDLPESDRCCTRVSIRRAGRVRGVSRMSLRVPSAAQ